MSYQITRDGEFYTGPMPLALAKKLIRIYQDGKAKYKVEPYQSPWAEVQELELPMDAVVRDENRYNERNHRHGVVFAGD